MENSKRLQQKDLLESVLAYLCHPKCLYDFCPLEQLDGEIDQARWQRWGEILDRMKNRAVLLCKDSGKKRKIFLNES